MSSPDRDPMTLLRRQLDAVYAQSRWHSIRAALQDLAEEEAVWTPPHFAGFEFMDGSIRDIVFHVGADKLFQVSQRFGDGSDTWEALSARFDGEGRTLAAALRILEEGQQALLAAAESLSDDELGRDTFLNGRPMSVENFLLMMIEHDAYHAGQIRYIRNLMEGGR